ncbi:MAG: arginine--tRNA ligase [bacterium]
MIRDYLTELIIEGVHRIGYLKGVDLPANLIERPKVAAHGDYASNVALTVAKLVGHSPQLVAQDIVRSLQPDPRWVEQVETVPPGFINFRLTRQWLWDSLRGIIKQGAAYGRCDLGGGKRVQIEFVSANPTGPLNVVSARAAAVGDALANILISVGYAVEREYYVNDAGKQVDLLAESVDAAYHRLLGVEMATPEGGYRGGYVEDIAESILDQEDGKCVEMDTAQRRAMFRTIAIKKILNDQKETLGRFRLVYDVWFREGDLRETGALDSVLTKLSERQYVYEQNGATWFRSTLFGDEKDRVLVTSDGQPTYFLADIAYHQNKFERTFERVIDLWGPDHHGHIPRMKAAIEALGYDPAALELKIVQQVNLIQAGQKAKMSKREGRLVSMRELIDEVGVDVARFFFLMRKTRAHLEFDLDLAKEQSDENPVYYVQYGHARICSILRHAEELGVKRPGPETVDLSLLVAEEETALIRKLLAYPEVVERCARSLEPHGLTTYLQEVAAVFHPFYHRHRVVTEDSELTAARLMLVEAVKIVLKNGLSLLGISAPERM